MMTTRKFVYELPYSVRKSLCRILDATDKWEELGGEHMGFDYTYLQYIRRKDSPTDELLTSWGNQNHSVDDLFVLLSKMQHYRAMSLLKDLVNERYHHLLREGEELMSWPPDQKEVRDRGNSDRTDQSPSKSQSQFTGTHPPGAVAFANRNPPHSNEDNKDLGLDKYNINLADQKARSKTFRKNNEEDKIQNLATVNNRRHLNVNNNVGPQNTTGQAGSSQPSRSPQPPCERKLSNESVNSSMLEGLTPRLDFTELETATNNWDVTCILGRGGFGTVYKGTWKNTLVAIKKLDSQKDYQPSESNPNQMPQSMRELKYLNSHRHDNILSLYGYSVTDSVACLVYQYMANGSLEDRLLCKQNTKPLNWEQRLKIMTGTARGIQFLHSLGKKPLVHGDIKSANILLDGNFEPRIGDFGLAREGPLQQYTHVKVSRVHGTRPYLPDEFLRAKHFSVKVDTYSFGVVLFEVATGLRAYDDSRREKFLKDHVVNYAGELSALADPQAGQDLCNSAAGLLTLGSNCVVDRPKDRPDMTSVLTDIDMLYKNYLVADRAIRLARQRSLTPTNPLEMQVAHDERLQTPSPSLPFPFSGTPLPPQLYQSPWVYPQPLPATSHHFVKIVGHNQHLPPTFTVQPPSTQSTTPSPVPTSQQTGSSYRSPSPLDSNHLPLLTLLKIRAEDESSEQDVSDRVKQASDANVSESSVVSSSCSQSSLSNTEHSRAELLSDFDVSLPNDAQTGSMYLPQIPELLGIKQASG